MLRARELDRGDQNVLANEVSRSPPPSCAGKWKQAKGHSWQRKQVGIMEHVREIAWNLGWLSNIKCGSLDFLLGASVTNSPGWLDPPPFHLFVFSEPFIHHASVPQTTLPTIYRLQGALGTRPITSWAPWHLQSYWTAPWLSLHGLSTSITSLLSPTWVLVLTSAPVHLPRAGWLAWL